jgi:ketosteroid isomerase-like protein
MQDTFIPPWDGAEAGRSERLAIVSLVKRYYAAAAASDGAHACMMLSADIVAGLSEDPQSSSSPTRQRACTAALSRVYKMQHRLLAEDDVSTMVIVDVRINRDVATAIVGFRTMPVGSVRLLRKKGTWKIDAILDDRMLS